MGDEKDSSKFRVFALAFMKEAKEDLEIAEELIESERYARSFSSSQQCIEKSVKALLEMEKIFVAEHDLSAFFVKFIYNNNNYREFKKELDRILEILDYFDGEWARTRYPHETRGKVVTPTEIYKNEDALIALEKAKEVYNTIKNILIKKFKFNEKDIK